ncbi:poly-gamma-glutamate system protein [candidate division WOR-3 bacterium]|nr:poly-gamma-glutamate system protein [candidate division WOR-3 bacterium]
MKRREGKISILSLSIATVVTIMLMTVVLNSKTRVRSKYYTEKMAAALTAQSAFSAVKQTVNEMGILIDRINDPNETGLIGIQYSPITTARGDLDPKLTSTNPNFAASVVHLLKQIGLRKNDSVAVLLTGSFPALNISVISAVQALELEPVIITSVGSSMWGANFPEFTYLDMETMLMDRGIFRSNSAAASMGGEDGIGRGLSPAGRELIIGAASRNNVPMLNAANLDEMIAKKIDLYTAGGRIKAFVNAGDITSALVGTEAGNGLIRPHIVKSGPGLVALFSKSGVPVINLVDIVQFARENDLPVAPIPLPVPGEGRIYNEYKYSVTMAVIAALIIVAILFVVLRFDIDHYLKGSKND